VGADWYTANTTIRYLKVETMKHIGNYLQYRGPIGPGPIGPGHTSLDCSCYLGQSDNLEPEQIKVKECTKCGEK